MLGKQLMNLIKINNNEHMNNQSNKRAMLFKKLHTHKHKDTFLLILCHHKSIKPHKYHNPIHAKGGKQHANNYDTNNMHMHFNKQNGTNRQNSTKLSLMNIFTNQTSYHIYLSIQRHSNQFHIKKASPIKSYKSQK